MLGTFTSIQGRLLAAVTIGIATLVIIGSIAIARLTDTVGNFDVLVNQSIAYEREINRLNYTFKVQVQEWKNVLLRGKDPAQLQKYWAQFESLQQEIQSSGDRLSRNLPKGKSQQLLADFLLAHQAAHQKYQAGLEAFKAAGFDSTAGDTAVTGIDRQPSELLDQAAELIGVQVQEETKKDLEISASVAIWSNVWVVIGGIVVLLAVWWTLKVSLIQPLIVINKHLALLATGNFRQHLPLDEKGELGELGSNIGEVQRNVTNIISAVKESASTLTRASQQITETAAHLARYTDDTHGSTDQVSAAINEMTSTVQDVASNASGAAEAAQNADTNARLGLQVMENTLGAISQLSDEVNNVGAAMTKLETDTSRIGGVLDVIKNVAEQTNLLALNAAIEAARAGEQGRGFAVVADEVRSLAKRTQESTAEIQQIIEAVQQGAAAAMQAMKLSQGKTHSTLEMAGQAGQSINEITKAIAAILGMNMQIATAAEEQSYAAEEINKNVQNVVRLVGNANQDAQKSAHIAKDLDGAAKGLEQQIARFSI